MLNRESFECSDSDRNNGNAGKPSGNCCLGQSTVRASAGVRGYHLRKECWDCICKILQSCAFVAGKMVRDAVHNAFLNTVTMGTAFPRVAPWNDRWWSVESVWANNFTERIHWRRNLLFICPQNTSYCRFSEDYQISVIILTTAAGIRTKFDNPINRIALHRHATLLSLSLLLCLFFWLFKILEKFVGARKLKDRDTKLGLNFFTVLLEAPKLR